jgi:hypothetical protein
MIKYGKCSLEFQLEFSTLSHLGGQQRLAGRLKRGGLVVHETADEIGALPCKTARRVIANVCGS